MSSADRGEPSRAEPDHSACFSRIIIFYTGLNVRESLLMKVS